MMKNAFYFILKAFCRSPDIEIFVLDFWSCRKNILMKKIILKFPTSQREKQTIAIQILPNISQSKGNQTMKFEQLI